ncbi:hypothetical protein P692DRAFT_20215985 [Suillus brevipes Sb2]|nr:hypothetical protein P692DRAFT_20215985 [Suillus brevipes Sb2]
MTKTRMTLIFGRPMRFRTSTRYSHILFLLRLYICCRLSCMVFAPTTYFLFSWNRTVHALHSFTLLRSLFFKLLLLSSSPC